MSNTTYILKHPFNVRLFHYILIISFLPLAVTGVLLYFKPLSEGAMNLSMQIHIIAGILLAVGALAFCLIAWDRLVLFTKRVFTISTNDFKWFAVLGGYPQKILFRKKIDLPPMGKYNSGQKLFGAAILLGGTILIGTGLVLWGFPHNSPRGTVALFGTLHTYIGLFLTCFLPIHLFLAVYMFDDFKAMMVHGKIPYEEARATSPLWVEKEITPLS
jgi:formate dehydrogenase subunit gamma